METQTMTPYTQRKVGGRMVDVKPEDCSSCMGDSFVVISTEDETLRQCIDCYRQWID